MLGLSESGMQMVPASQCIDKESMCFHPELNQFVSYPVLIGGHVGYLVVIWLLKQIMAGRKDPIEPKLLMYVYNPLQVIFSSLQVIGLAPFLLNNFFNLDGHFCARIEFWIFFHYCTKYLDMLDSVFMCLRKKSDQLSFLHVYHHVAMFFIWWFAVKFCAGGDGIAGPVFNTFVHAVMYTYYLATSLGVTIPGKRYLTQLQMTQLFCVTMHSVLVIVLDCKYPHWTQYAQIAFLMSLLYLFWQFYKGAYKGKSGKRKSA
mmetsp:Transcript_33933/g.104765  ORF Transcript_33933/g.104765 Transcript_33933/m.104765 type:complete len:259 (-) Transcript_33933:62-838(-)